MLESARKLQIFLVSTLLLYQTTCQENVAYNPYYHFPGGSEGFMGLIATVAVPIEAGTPGEVVFSVLTEASYILPTNETEFDDPPVISNQATSERTIIYRLLEGKLEEFGYAGKNCLLRTICESIEYSTRHTGVMGDIIHILLTPSTSRKEPTLVDYEIAEELGKRKLCQEYRRVCGKSVLDAISKIKSLLNTE